MGPICFSCRVPLEPTLTASGEVDLACPGCGTTHRADAQRGPIRTLTISVELPAVGLAEVAG